MQHQKSSKPEVAAHKLFSFAISVYKSRKGDSHHPRLLAILTTYKSPQVFDKLMTELVLDFGIKGESLSATSPWNNKQRQSQRT